MFLSLCPHVAPLSNWNLRPTRRPRDRSRMAWIGCLDGSVRSQSSSTTVAGSLLWFCFWWWVNAVLRLAFAEPAGIFHWHECPCHHYVAEPWTTSNSSWSTWEGKNVSLCLPRWWHWWSTLEINCLTHCIKVKVHLYHITCCDKFIFSFECNHPHMVSLSRLPHLIFEDPGSFMFSSTSLISFHSQRVPLEQPGATCSSLRWPGQPLGYFKVLTRLAVSLKIVGMIHTTLVNWNFDPWQPSVDMQSCHTWLFRNT